MSRALLNKITLVLALVGCFIALVLTYEHFRPAADIGCSLVGGDCHSTIESKYGKLGPIPTSLLGLGMYLTLAGICVLRARSLAGRNAPGPDEKQLGATLFGISLLAFCISWWLQYAALYLVTSFCPWCFGSALTVTAIFLVNCYDQLIIGRALTGEQKMLTGVVAFIGVMLSFVYGPGVLDQYKIATSPRTVKEPGLPPGQVNPPFVHPRAELLTSDLHFKGKPTAAYTIVEFADYACTHCREASEEIDKMVAHQPDRYRLAFRNFPLGKWPHSAEEAAAAEAAGKQGKFWEMHDVMFAHQVEVDDLDFGTETILRWAKSIGLDVARLKKDMTSAKIKDYVAHDRYIALKNRINLTPSFFIVPADPQQKVMMLIGGTDAKVVLNNPSDPFWRGDPSSLKNPESAK
jgi:uncharacterized membrane protein/predicted DsbA family dithiol-disulfide isomerase